MSATLMALVLVAGAVGAVVRAAVVAAIPRVGTGLVNVVGTVVLATCWAHSPSGGLAPEVAAVAGLGLAGSLTTFSGWVARVDAGLAVAPARTAVVEVLVPLAAGVGLTVAALVAFA